MTGSRIKRRLFLLRWHRRIGVMAAFIVVVLVVSGMLVRHADTLGLTNVQLRQKWVIAGYVRFDDANFMHYKTRHGWASYGADALHWQGKKVADLYEPPVGAVELGDTVVIASGDELIWLSADGLLIDRVSRHLLNIPAITGLGAAGDTLATRAAGGNFVCDAELTACEEATLGGASAWSVRGTPPDDVLVALRSETMSEGIPLDKVLLDVHNGRYFGFLGPWLMDMAGLALLWLAGTGTYNWWQRR